MTQHDTKPEFRWPDDYVRLKGGLLVRPDCVEGFRELGWVSLDHLMISKDVHVVREVDSRDNCTVTIPTAGGPVDAYLKRHRIRSFRRWYIESRRHRSARSPGMSEAGAVQWCQQAGIPTMSIIAAGEKRLAKGWWSDSLFMSEAMTGHLPANEHWFPAARRFDPPDGFASDAETRRRVLRAVASTARRFHEANLFHYDFYLEHFFVDSTTNVARLIDLQRVERHTKGPLRWRALNKDLAQFLSSCQRYQLSPDEFEFWKRCYLNGHENVTELRSLDRMKFSAATGRLHVRRLRKWRRNLAPRKRAA